MSKPRRSNGVLTTALGKWCRSGEFDCCKSCGTSERPHGRTWLSAFASDAIPTTTTTATEKMRFASESSSASIKEQAWQNLLRAEEIYKEASK